VIPVGVVGASGFAGGELLRLLAGHPEFALRYASRSGAAESPTVARPVSALHPHLGHGKDWRSLTVGPTRVEEAAERCAAVFLATPAEVSAELAPALLAAGVEVVVDLSPAFRLHHPAVHRRWYPKVSRTEPVEAVYGLPELNRAAIGTARLIAAPGCLATAAILSLLPLCELSGVGLSSITIDGKTGSTGSGNTVRETGLHAVRSGVVSPYAPVGHRHTAEIRQALRGRGLRTTDGLRLGMSVYSVDLVRGLSVAAYVMVERDGPGRRRLDLDELYAEVYRDEPFVRVRDWRDGRVPMPDPKVTVGSNYCDVAAFHDTDADRFVLIAALDNLIKGAAGQAVQACNIRYGLADELGLAALPLFPV